MIITTATRRSGRRTLRVATRRPITIGYGRYMPALTVTAVKAERMTDADWPSRAECPCHE